MHVSHQCSLRHRMGQASTSSDCKVGDGRQKEIMSKLGTLPICSSPLNGVLDRHFGKSPRGGWGPIPLIIRILPECSLRPSNTSGLAFFELEPQTPTGLDSLDQPGEENDVLLSNQVQPTPTPALNLTAASLNAHECLAFELFGFSALLPPHHHQTHEPVNLKKD